MPPKVRSLRLEDKTFDFVHVPLHFVDRPKPGRFRQQEQQDSSRDADSSSVHESDRHVRRRVLATPGLAFGRSPSSTQGLRRCLLPTVSEPVRRPRIFDFSISDPSALGARGVYAYYSNDVLAYIGRCKDSMRKRVNQGYGKIHPKNCFRDGQATNCHLNARIAAATSDVTLWLCQMDNRGDIEAAERS